MTTVFGKNKIKLKKQRNPPTNSNFQNDIEKIYMTEVQIWQMLLPQFLLTSNKQVLKQKQ